MLQVAEAGEFKITNPLDTAPTLFREFASLDPGDLPGMLAFADAYGMLVTTEEADSRYEDSATKSAGGPGKEAYDQDFLAAHRLTRTGETDAFWMGCISDMARTVELWDRANIGDTQYLDPLLVRMSYEEGWEWLSKRADRPEYYMPVPECDEVWTYTPHLPREAWPDDDTLHEDGDAEVIRYLPGDDKVAAAKRLVTGIIGAGIGDCSPQIRQDPRGGGYFFEIFPRTLLEAMWVQFAQSITGNKQQRACKVCGTWFEISADDQGGGTRKLFCSTNCKVRDSRQRKTQAELLRREGKSLKQIAEATGTSLDTVKKWVGKK